jgi:hypothetical protein
VSAKKEKEQDTNPDNSIKIKKRRWDGLVIGIFMAIGFSVIIMKLTHHWPCEIISMVGNIHQISPCDKSIEENLSSLVNWFRQGLSPHFL